MDANHAARCEGHRKLQKKTEDRGKEAALTEIISNKTKKILYHIALLMKVLIRAIPGDGMAAFISQMTQLRLPKCFSDIYFGSDNLGFNCQRKFHTKKK